MKLQIGVAASRQRAALFNLLGKCGGLPTAATMQRSSGLLRAGTFSIVGASEY
jgi:hypothetical protein